MQKSLKHCFVFVSFYKECVKYVTTTMKYLFNLLVICTVISVQKRNYCRVVHVCLGYVCTI